MNIRYENILRDELKKSRAFGYAVLNHRGEVLDSNTAFIGIFSLPVTDDRSDSGMKPEKLDLIRNMVNPVFYEIIETADTDNTIFDGIMTIGNGREISRSFPGKIYSTGTGPGIETETETEADTETRTKKEYLLILEYDAQEFQTINTNLSDLNREITNLQRTLIREKKELQLTLQKLRETQQMLIQSEKMNALGQLVAGIAHEINNPIAFVDNNLHALRDVVESLTSAFTAAETMLQKHCPEQLKDADLRGEYDLDFIIEDTPDLLSGSLDGLKRVKHIVENLRTFSRLDEARYKEADLQENIKATVAIAQPELTKRNIRVIYDLEPVSGFMAYVSELNQVFLNLILNAAQAIGVDGEITIKTRTEGETVVIEISDNGQGIPEERMAKIFDPFFTTKPVGEGTGLGLSIAYKIITETHKGRIDVLSQLRKGSTFKLTLPRRIDHE